MIRRYMTPLKVALVTSDALSAVLLFMLLVNVRFDVLDGTWSASANPIQIAVAYAALWVSGLWFVGLYRLRTHWTMRGEIFEIVRATIMVAFASLAVLYIFDLTRVSRLLVLMLFIAQPIVTAVLRISLRWTIQALRRNGYMRREMLILGAGPDAEVFANTVETMRDLGMHVIGHLRALDESGTDVSRPVLGNIDEIESLLRTRVIDEVAVCLSPADWALVEPATRLSEEYGKIVRVSIQPLNGVLSGGRFEEVEGTQIVTFLFGNDRLMGMLIKRVIDIAVSATLLLFLTPLIVAIAAYLAIVDGRPILFRHQRVGLNGRMFTCLKFRTMVSDADARLAEVEHLNDLNGPAFKIRNDPRVTRTGAFLRRTSLDELPQLFNVLRGEMSIVGPRPAPIREVDGYSPWHRRRLSMRPGLTGLWQVTARHSSSFDERAHLDLDYIDRWSLWMDLKIMAKTIPSVVRLEGR